VVRIWGEGVLIFSVVGCGRLGFFLIGGGGVLL